MIMTCLTVHEVEHCIKIFSWNQGVKDNLKRWMAAKFGRVLIDCYLNLNGGFNKNIPLLCSLLQCLAIPYE